MFDFAGCMLPSSKLLAIKLSAKNTIATKFRENNEFPFVRNARKKSCQIFCAKRRTAEQPNPNKIIISDFFFRINKRKRNTDQRRERIIDCYLVKRNLNKIP